MAEWWTFTQHFGSTAYHFRVGYPKQWAHPLLSPGGRDNGHEQQAYLDAISPTLSIKAVSLSSTYVAIIQADMDDTVNMKLEVIMAKLLMELYLEK
jgi:hypothetical protein